jgi:hypothetical protein
VAIGSVIARIITQYSDKGSKAAQRDITKLGKQFDEFGKRAFKAFAVAGVAAATFAVKIGKDAVEGAIEDQKAQAALALALRNTTNASDAVVASTVQYLDKLELATGVNNNELIPSLQRLVTATGDVTQAQQLQALALDVSAGTGRSLAQVTESFARALGGSLTALRRIAPTLDENIIKNKDLSAAFEQLSAIYGGQAATRAETFEFKMLRLSLAFDQVLDSLGYALIPVLENFIGYIQTQVLPVLDAWVGANKDDIANSLQSVIENSIKAGKAIARFVGFISDNLQVIKNFGALLFGIFVGAKVYAGITAITAAITLLRAAFVKQAAAAGTAAVATAAATGGASLLTAGAAIVAFTAATGIALGALNKIQDATDKTAKNLQGQRQSIREIESRSGKIAGFTATTFDFTGKTVTATKKLTAEQQKRLNAQKAINKAKLDEFGIKNVSTTDPISLEAARLNLLKEGQLAEVKRLEAMMKFYEQQDAINTLSTRYADILAIINDRQVSPAEVALLAAKWGETEAAVIDYVAKVTGAPLPEGWNDPGNAAADGWKSALDALNTYYGALKNPPVITVPGFTGGGNVTGGGGVTGGNDTMAIPVIPTAPSGDPFAGTPLAGITASDLADAFGLSSLSDLGAFGVSGNPQNITINVSGTGDLSDDTKRQIVETIVDASSIGYNTGWYRTTGTIAV